MNFLSPFIFFSFNFTLVEKIGGSLFLSCIDPDLGSIGVLKCYEDNEIGMFCDENLWTHLDDTSTSYSIDVYPNPSIKEFVVEFNNLLFTDIESSYIRIVDSRGKFIKKIHLKQNVAKYTHREGPAC